MFQYLSSTPAALRKLIDKKPLATSVMVFLTIIILMLAVNEIRFMIPDGHGILHVSYQEVPAEIANRSTELNPGFIKEWQPISSPRNMLNEAFPIQKRGLFLLRISLDHSQAPIAKPVLHLSRVYGGTYHIYDSDFKHLSTITTPLNQNPYNYLLNESFTLLSPKDTSVYILLEKHEPIPMIGIGARSGVFDFQSIAYQNFDFSKTRHAIAMVLILITIAIFALEPLLYSKPRLSIATSIAVFLGLFGTWSLTDFTRHSYWILNTFDKFPVQLLLLAYIFSSALMTPAFVNLNYQLLNTVKYKKMIKMLFYFTSMVAILSAALETTRLFVWNDTLHQLYSLAYTITDATITCGSLLLIIVALLDIRYEKLHGLIYLVGLVFCLGTFTISQTSPYLISHWGVIGLLFSVALVITLNYTEIQHKKKDYMDELVIANHKMEAMNADLEMTQNELLLRLGSTVDLRSKETSLHVQRVAAYTQIIAEKMGYSEEESKLISMASTLHDIGKVGIPDCILNEPGELSQPDYEEMKKHARMGFDILNGSYNNLLDTAAIIALSHHEKYDGSGYPDHLSGDEIPIYGAIVAAADVLDALLSKRVYKSAWSIDEVIGYFEANRGCHFHPQVVDVILQNKNLLHSIIEELPY